MQRYTRGLTQHAYYVPLFFLLIPIVFWVVIAILHRDNVDMIVLVKNGWLFRVDVSANEQLGVGNTWNYWRAFKFSKVDSHAFKSASTNIALVVFIGVLNLSAFTPALSLSLDLPVNMNHEFIGQGAANILAGIAGTVPNILVGSETYRI